ncbi:sensor histidine kinase [Nocardioides houyundeii]|uniref:sensor histidine kinase n=1 Tax=Nocardioides houyundeii TaxID=2045452 RepID=UPI000C7874FD|nr:sensor histidine kinase [Nocardioides houyundeii]
MSPTRGLSLSSRVIASNGVLFLLGTAVLAFSPATVSRQPVISELVVLLVGLGIMIVANSLLVRVALTPLDRLVTQLDQVRSNEPLARVSDPGGGLAHRLSLAVNDLLDRIEAGQRQNAVSALAAQEAERSRIAQELHDGVGQSLTAVLLELGAISGPGRAPAEPALARIREGVRASLDEVRSVARHLRPHVLEDLGLRSALAALTNDLFTTGDVLVRRGILPGLPALPDDVELVVFRVAQEALTNVARHARARTVELALSTVGEQLVLVVADDGRGIPPDAAGTGLRGMHERAALIGARLHVGRRDGGGTVVELRVPLERP